MSKYFPHSETCLFTLFIVSFGAKQFLILMKSKLSIFFLLLVSYPRSHCQVQSHENFPLFSSKSFIVLNLIFWSFIHFELLFMAQGKGPTSFFCVWISSFPSTIS